MNEFFYNQPMAQYMHIILKKKKKNFGVSQTLY